MVVVFFCRFVCVLMVGPFNDGVGSVSCKGELLNLVMTKDRDDVMMSEDGDDVIDEYNTNLIIVSGVC